MSRLPIVQMLYKFDSFIEIAVPHLRLFLSLSMMPLKRCVATKNDWKAEGLKHTAFLYFVVDGLS